jgi:hypothetical protein
MIRENELNKKNMNTKNKATKKYITPMIEFIRLDNEISLVLQSNLSPDPEPGNWGTYNMQQQITNDPFKIGTT